jgi:Tfp pilus assembly protein PilF
MGEAGFDRATADHERRVVVRQSGWRRWRLVLPSITLLSVVFLGMWQTNLTDEAIPVLAGIAVLLGVLFFPMAPGLFQTLTLDAAGLCWRFGRWEWRCTWREVTGLRLVGGRHGRTVIEMEDGPPMVLNGTWEIGRSELVTLLQRHLQMATGRVVPVLEPEVRPGTRDWRWPVLGAAAVLLIVSGVSAFFIGSGGVPVPAREVPTANDASVPQGQPGAAKDDLGADDPALAPFNKALAIQPDNVAARLGRCLAYAHKDQDYQGFLDCAEAARLDPKYVPLALLLHGMASEATGQYDQALDDFNRIFPIEPNNAMAFAARCNVRVMMGDTDQALVDCNHALALSPSKAEYLGVRGFVYLKTGRFAEAQADFDMSLGLKPNLASALYGRGLLERRNGQESAAEADIEAAERLWPNVAHEVAQYRLRL